MRKTYVFDRTTLQLVPKDEFYARAQEVNAPMVIGDIQPYQSQIDGSMISSRSQHRSHLRQHGCVEIGNETKALYAQTTPKGPPPGLKDALIRAFHERGL